MPNSTFFPLPRLLAGTRIDGFRRPWPRRCVDCPSRECEAATSSELRLCSFGLHYVRVDSRLILAGFAARDVPVLTQAQKKRLREAGKNSVGADELDKLLAALRTQTVESTDLLAAERARTIAEYREKHQYKADFLQELRAELQRALSYVHDYKQFLSQVNQQINVLIESRPGSLGFDDKLRRAAPAEQSIYWAAKLMDAKLESSLLLLHPDRISDASRFTTFQFHKLVTKYLRIYEASARARGVRFVTVGSSFGSVRGNSEAIAVIPHTFIDNACKYAPRNSEIHVEFDESDGALRFSVTSLGPRIEDSERKRIFELFARGAAAIAAEEEGMGFGLYLSQFIAKAIGTEISVRQSATPQVGLRCFETTFAVDFQLT